MKGFNYGTPKGQLIDKVQQASERGDDVIVLSRPKNATADTPHQAWSSVDENQTSAFLRNAIPELAD